MIQRQRTAESLRRSVWPPLPSILREQRRGNSLVLSGGRVGEYVAEEGKGKEARDPASRGKLGLSCVTGRALLGKSVCLGQSCWIKYMFTLLPARCSYWLTFIPGCTRLSASLLEKAEIDHEMLPLTRDWGPGCGEEVPPLWLSISEGLLWLQTSAVSADYPR